MGNKLIKWVVFVSSFILFCSFLSFSNNPNYDSNKHLLSEFKLSFGKYHKIVDSYKIDFYNIGKKNEKTDSSFYGYGYLTLDQKNKKSVIIKVFEGSDAKNAGLEIGDIILGQKYIGETEVLDIIKSSEFKEIYVNKSNYQYSSSDLNKLNDLISLEMRPFGDIDHSVLINISKILDSKVYNWVNFRGYLDVIGMIIQLSFWLFCALPAILLGVILKNSFLKMYGFFRVIVPLIIFTISTISFTIYLSSFQVIDMIIRSPHMSQGGFFIDMSSLMYPFNAILISLLLAFSYLYVMFGNSDLYKKSPN